MKPAPFDYASAESVRHVVELLRQHGEDASILAGGQSLIALLNLRLLQPRVLVDISRTPELTGLSAETERLAIGAAVTQSQVQRLPDLALKVPLLAMALPYIGHFPTRNKGTVCGSIAHADPTAELPLCLALLRGEIVLASTKGERTVAADDFFTGPMRTARTAVELITRVDFPAQRPQERYGFRKMSIRQGDPAIVAVATMVTSTTIRIGVAGGPDRVQLRDWPMLEGSALDDALDAFAREIDFQDDLQTGATLRRHLVRTLARQAIKEACACES